MRFWFRRREHMAENEAEQKAGKQPRAASRKAKKQSTARHRQSRPSGPPGYDPIRDWESDDQKFLRQAGDPFG